MNFKDSKDESLLALYESVRRQVEKDQFQKRRFMGNAAKEYADRLRAEMENRRIEFKPISWPRDLPS
jgi:hypothetical protein